MHNACANATFSHSTRNWKFTWALALCIKLPIRRHTNKCYMRSASVFRCAMQCAARSILIRINIVQWDVEECMMLTHFSLSIVHGKCVKNPTFSHVSLIDMQSVMYVANLDPMKNTLKSLVRVRSTRVVWMVRVLIWCDDLIIYFTWNGCFWGVNRNETEKSFSYPIVCSALDSLLLICLCPTFFCRFSHCRNVYI